MNDDTNLFMEVDFSSEPSSGELPRIPIAKLPLPRTPPKLPPRNNLRKPPPPPTLPDLYRKRPQPPPRSEADDPIYLQIY